MPWDLEKAVLERAFKAGLIRMEDLLQKGIIDQATLDRLMEEVEEDEDPVAADQEPEAEFGPYENLEFLGEGGMSRVYKAHDPVLARDVALKFLRTDETELRERLLKEARAQARVDHPHICRVYEAGELSGKTFIAMQYIAGKTLKDAAADLALEQKIRLMADVSEAVHEAHRAGLIHRDLKPTNIMAEQKDGEWIPYVLDFGVVHEMDRPGQTSTGALIGSPAYMSPEQARGEKANLDRRSDVFSLGVVLYELLSGALPFEADSAMGALMKIQQDEPPPLRKRNPALPEDLETIALTCLEKEPARRYPSAKALAEDLRRYLDGAPIQAKRAAWLYRIRKQIARNKAVSFALAVAVFWVIAMTAFGLRNYFSVQKQAFLSQKFGQKIKEMEGIMRVAYMLPLHDLTPQKNLVRKRMKEIEATMSGGGFAGFGPGHYALGRGHLALQEWEEAERSLKEAWNSGYQEPEVAYALGEALGALYERKLIELGRIQPAGLRERKKKELDDAFRTPALFYLEKGRSVDVESSEYLEALLAYYDHRWDEARAKARQACVKVPWLFEARRLLARIELFQGNGIIDAGDVKGGMEHFRKAEDAYKEVIRLAPSDAESREGLCRLASFMMDVQWYTNGEDPTALKDEAVSSCRSALLTEPDMADADVTLADVMRTWAEFQSINGKDPMAPIGEAIRFAREALHKDPRNDRAYYSLGTAYEAQGEHQIRLGMDPRQSLSAAADALHMNLQLDREAWKARNGLGNLYWDLGDYQSSHGIDPTPSFDSAIENYQDVTLTHPEIVMTFSNMGGIYSSKADYEISHGRNPEASIDLSLKNNQRALQLNPHFAMCHNNVAYAWLIKSRYLASTGGDPRPALSEAIAGFRKAMQINPNDPDYASNCLASYGYEAAYALATGGDPGPALKDALQLADQLLRSNPEDAPGLLGQADVWRLMGEFDLQHGRNPEANFLKSVAIYREAQKRNPDSMEACLQPARIALLRADLQIRQRRSPLRNLDQANEFLAQAMKIDSGEMEALCGMADAHRYRAEWLVMQHQPAESDINAGLQLANKALAINPKSAEARAIRGRLEMLDPGTAEAGKADIKNALAVNRNIEKRLVAP